MMSKRLGLSVVAASLLFGSAPGFAGGGSTTSAIHNLVTNPPGHDDAPEKLVSLFRQAPVGHRQLRPSDIPETTQLSPLESELRRIDKEIDEKLIICRGC
jgi:hypothetical protein